MTYIKEEDLKDKRPYSIRQFEDLKDGIEGMKSIDFEFFKQRNKDLHIKEIKEKKLKKEENKKLKAKENIRNKGRI